MRQSSTPSFLDQAKTWISGLSVSDYSDLRSQGFDHKESSDLLKDGVSPEHTKVALEHGAGHTTILNMGPQEGAVRDLSESLAAGGDLERSIDTAFKGTGEQYTALLESGMSASAIEAMHENGVGLEKLVELAADGAPLEAMGRCLDAGMTGGQVLEALEKFENFAETYSYQLRDIAGVQAEPLEQLSSLAEKAVDALMEKCADFAENGQGNQGAQLAMRDARGDYYVADELRYQDYINSPEGIQDRAAQAAVTETHESLEVTSSESPTPQAGGAESGAEAHLEME